MGEVVAQLLQAQRYRVSLPKSILFIVDTKSEVSWGLPQFSMKPNHDVSFVVVRAVGLKEEPALVVVVVVVRAAYQDTDVASIEGIAGRGPREEREGWSLRPVGLVDVVVNILLLLSPFSPDRDADQDEPLLRGEDGRLHVDLGGVRAVDAHVRYARRAAETAGDLDLLAIAGLGEGGGGVVALGDVGFKLDEHEGELFLGSGGVVGGERRRVRGGRVETADAHGAARGSAWLDWIYSVYGG